MGGKGRTHPDLADHGATMELLRSSAGGDPEKLEKIRVWGERRQRRLPVLRRFAALLGSHGVIDAEMHRVTRDFVIAQCFAIATGHGLDMMGYTYRDSMSGPLSGLMGVDLHAVELGGTDTGELFPDGAAEREFLAEIGGKSHDELGRIARLALIPELERMTLP